MNEDIIKNLIVNKSKQTMIDSIDNMDDINFLKSELKTQLREKWNEQAKKESLIKYLNNLLTDKKEINKFIVTSVENLLERIKNNNYE